MSSKKKTQQKQKSKPKTQPKVKPMIYHNLDSIVEDKSIDTVKMEHQHPLIPKSYWRILACGPSGSGKTNHIIDLALNYLAFDRVYLFASNINQDKYQWFIKRFQALEKKLGREIIFVEDQYENIPEIEDISADYHNLVLIDDFVTVRKQEKLKKYFTKSRHHHCDVVYMSQGYISTPKDIRDNTSIFLLFPGLSGREIQEVRSNVVRGDMDLEKFRRMYSEATEERGSFLTVINDPNMELQKRYRKRWDKAYHIEKK